MLIGKRFVLPANRIPLPIDAAMAFGSGRHETTLLCLAAIGWFQYQPLWDLITRDQPDLFG